MKEISINIEWPQSETMMIHSTDEATTARQALAANPWFNQMVSSKKLVESSFRMQKDSIIHYVMGINSPFYFRMGVSPDTKNIVAAVWCGEHATNMGNMVQGGAISSIFDALTASVGSIQVEPMSFGTTKNLSVSFLRPTPLFQVIKFSVVKASFNHDNGTALVEAQLTNGKTSTHEQTYATCTAEMVDMKRRKQWKTKRKNLNVSKL